MPYIFGKLWHLAIIWAIRKAFQFILQGVRFLLANHTRLSPTSENDSYISNTRVNTRILPFCLLPRRTFTILHSYDNSDYDLLKIWIGSKLSKVEVLSGNGDGDWIWLGSVKFNRPISPYAPHCLHLWAGLGSNLFCSQPPIHCLPYWHLGLLRLVSQYD